MPDGNVQDVSTTPPRTVDHLIGQQNVVEQIKIALAAYWNDRAARHRPCFGPVLMEGPPGTGKTLLAGIIARELGGTLKETLGQSLCCGGDDLHELLIEATDNSILFIDECHLMNHYVQTTLLRALEERKLLVPKGPFCSKYTAIELAQFTALFATTNSEGIISPLRERMKVVLQFAYYKNCELAMLCKQRARALNWAIQPEVLIAIGRCSKSTPRLALRLLESCRRTARAENAEQITKVHFKKTIGIEGLDQQYGLDRNEQSYLKALSENQGKMRLGSLALKLGLPSPMLASVTERFLIREGLVERTETGRQLTPKGWQYFQNRPEIENQPAE